MTDRDTPVPAMSATGLTCRRGQRTVLTDVGLSVRPGQRLALVGPNGSGKSTLLRVLAGIDAPAAGTVRIQGEDLRSLPHRSRARRVAVMSQEELTPSELTLAEAVALGRTPHRSPWAGSDTDDDTVVETCLARVGLAGRGHESVTRLSGGERHRVALARTLAQDTPIVVLDEPTNHLDAAWRQHLMGLIEGLDATIVAALHDLDLVLRHFDLVAVLAQGGLLAFGPPDQVLTSDLIRDVFAVMADIVAHPRTGRPHLLISGAAASDHTAPVVTPDFRTERYPR